MVLYTFPQWSTFTAVSYFGSVSVCMTLCPSFLQTTWPPGCRPSMRKLQLSMAVLPRCTRMSVGGARMTVRSAGARGVEVGVTVSSRHRRHQPGLVSHSLNTSRWATIETLLCATAQVNEPSSS